MYGALIKLVAHPGRRDELVAFLSESAAAARDEPGTLRFDIWAPADDPDVAYLYETYADEAAFEAHKAGPGFERWRSEVAPRCVAENVRVLPFAHTVASDAD